MAQYHTRAEYESSKVAERKVRKEQEIRDFWQKPFGCLITDAGKKHWLNANRTMTLAAAEPPCTHDPNEWMALNFPAIYQRYGSAFSLQTYDRDGLPCYEVRDLNDEFFAAVLGQPETPAVYHSEIKQWFRYSIATGIYEKVTDDQLIEPLSSYIHQCYTYVLSSLASDRLDTDLRSLKRLQKVLNRARSIYVADDEFFKIPDGYVVCNNGIVNLNANTLELLPFDPKYRFTSKIFFHFFQPDSNPDLFLNTFLRPIAGDEDIDLLQQYCGQMLLGINYSRRLLLLTGNTGKSTFIRILQGVLGESQCAVLREELLTNQFEMSRFLGKKLIHGADLPQRFYADTNIFKLRRLVSGDTMFVEEYHRGEVKTQEIHAQFNVVLACDKPPKIFTDGDEEEWTRKVAIVNFHQPSHGKTFGKLAETILKAEGPAILNWLIEGYRKLACNGYSLPLDQQSVEQMFSSTANPRQFVQECIIAADDGQLTLPECLDAYVDYCAAKGLSRVAKAEVKDIIEKEIYDRLGKRLRHDRRNTEGKLAHGWIGISYRQDHGLATAGCN